MSMETDGNLTVKGSDINVRGSGGNGGIKRSNLQQDATQVYEIPSWQWSVHDDLTSRLPSTTVSTNDDLALNSGTFGTTPGLIKAADANGSTASYTQRARTTFTLPPEYDDGQTLNFEVACRMNSTTLTPLTSLTVDLEAYEVDIDGGAYDGGDICATAAQTFESTSWATKTFTITPTTIAAGDQLDMRMSVAVSGTGYSVSAIPEIASTRIKADVKG